MTDCQSSVLSVLETPTQSVPCSWTQSVSRRLRCLVDVRVKELCRSPVSLLSSAFVLGEKSLYRAIEFTVQSLLTDLIYRHKTVE